jgi:hypothetical protein
MKPVAHALVGIDEACGTCARAMKAVAHALVIMALGKDEACRTCRFSYALVSIIHVLTYLSCRGEHRSEAVLKEAAVKEAQRVRPPALRQCSKSHPSNSQRSNRECCKRERKGL